jgi:hypothetical protein
VHATYTIVGGTHHHKHARYIGLQPATLVIDARDEDTACGLVDEESDDSTRPQDWAM